MYFLMYEECSEEHKYLLGLRREKNAFTRLIEEYAVCWPPSAAGRLLDARNIENAGISWRHSYGTNVIRRYDQDH